MAQDLSGEVKGWREVQKILRQIDRKALRQTQAFMRQAASPMVAQARALTPSESPLAGRLSNRTGGRTPGWSHRGRTGWRQQEVIAGIKVSVGGPPIRANQTWPLLTLTQSTAAGMIYDWAGRSRRYMKRPNEYFVGRLPRLGQIKGSEYSRVLFPAFVATREEVIAAILDGLDQVAKQVNAEITRV